MLVPMLLTPISAFAYAHWFTQLTCFTTLCGGKVDIEITKWKINCTNTLDANSNGKIFDDELTVKEIKDGCNGQIIGLKITADPIHPGWMLHLILQIHNRPSPYSVKAKIYFAIYYWNETTKQWVKITKEDLHNRFYIQYIDGFYLDADLTQPMPANYVLKAGKCIYKSEYIAFDENAQTNPTLQGQGIEFKVEICAERVCT
jgi:hypothetical protein